MSAGPINQDRAARKSPTVTTSAATAVHAFGPTLTLTKAYCGHRKPKVITADWAIVTCSECLASAAADKENDA
jgi:hypothetical protein